MALVDVVTGVSEPLELIRAEPLFVLAEVVTGRFFSFPVILLKMDFRPAGSSLWVLAICNEETARVDMLFVAAAEDSEACCFLMSMCLFNSAAASRLTSWDASSVVAVSLDLFVGGSST